MDCFSFRHDSSLHFDRQESLLRHILCFLVHPSTVDKQVLSVITIDGATVTRDVKVLASRFCLLSLLVLGSSEHIVKVRVAIRVEPIIVVTT